ncbi:MAG TPA: hypothetical protein EYO53_06230 [Alphaproteobacteria bacterium]|nr:hypothetical protein [Alphaproteobacteria bacterium]
MARFSFFVQHDPATGNIHFAEDNLRPAIRRVTVGNYELLLLGHPIVDGVRDDMSVRDAFIRTPDLADFAKSLDGGFLILLHNSAAHTLDVITDRFGSYAFYYVDEGGGRMRGSLSLIEAASEDAGPIDEDAIFEFFYLRRLLGEKTFLRDCRYQASASILTSGPNGLSIERYWQPDYNQTKLGREEAADAIVNALRDSVRLHMEGGADQKRRYTLFLSGGLDSRALLAAAEGPLDSVTTCLEPNNEVSVAREVAKCAGSPFTYIARPTMPYDGHIEDAVSMSGGQQIFSEGQFLAYAPLLAGHADCYFIGLGLDIFFGGLYLPKEPVRWFGRKTLHSRLLPLSSDLVGDYLNKIKYRLSTTNPWRFVKADRRHDMSERLRGSVEQILRQGRERGARDYDLWEYMHVHNLSRHYSFPMIQSVRTWAECRAPALSNKLFDISLRLAAAEKVNSGAYLRALRQMSPALMAIRNANTNISAGMPYWQQSFIRAGRFFSNRLFGSKFLLGPTNDQRSWPRPCDVLAVSKTLQDAVAKLPKSDALSTLSFMDLNEISTIVDEHQRGSHDHAVALFVLLTVERALAQMV